MNDENPPPDQSDKPVNSGPEIQGSEPANSPKTTQPNPTNEFQDVKKELSGYERSTLRWTIAIVAVNVLTCLFIGLQWYEIKSGSVDTQALAAAAAQQAVAANTQSQQAIAQTTKMAESLGKTDNLIAATNNLATQAKRQADIAHDAISATAESADQDRRPWVGLQLLQCNNCKTEADGSLIIGDLSAVLVNTGKTPAVDMIVDSTIVSTKASEPIPTYDAIEKQNEATRKRMEIIPSNLPPEIAADEAKSIEFIKRQMMPSKEVLAPNAPRGITIIVGFRQGRNMMMRREDQNVIYGLGKVTYYDTAHTIQHTTMSCVMNDFGTNFRYCPAGNQMN
jgi:hypothetical protein